MDLGRAHHQGIDMLGLQALIMQGNNAIDVLRGATTV